MLVVVLTGGIGSGKSTVARLLAERGAVVLDADRIAREVVEPGTPGLRRIVERFGSEVLDRDGALDRAAMARVAFADDEARRALEAIVHPLVGAEIQRRSAQAGDGAVVVHDVPLFVETGGADRGRTGPVVVVEAPLETRLARLEARGVDREDARARIAAQASDEERRAVADVVLDNGGDLGSLEHQVDELWGELTRRASAS